MSTVILGFQLPRDSLLLLHPRELDALQFSARRKKSSISQTPVLLSLEKQAGKLSVSILHMDLSEEM